MDNGPCLLQMTHSEEAGILQLSLTHSSFIIIGSPKRFPLLWSDPLNEGNNVRGVVRRTLSIFFCRK